MHACDVPRLPQIEALEEVERAFVHVDYAPRELPEHKVRAEVQDQPGVRRSSQPRIMLGHYWSGRTGISCVQNHLLYTNMPTEALRSCKPVGCHLLQTYRQC